MGQVIIRADASSQMGTGHVIRCLTLADALREREMKVLFVCREHQGHLCALVAERGHAIRPLPLAKAGDAIGVTSGYEAWLGDSWQADATVTRSIVDTAKATPDWLVVDHYGIDRRWESQLRGSVRHIMAIDDLADRAHDCDLLLDQNFVADMDDRYIGKIPPGCESLLGPRWALLQPAYAALHEQVAERQGPVRSVLVFFGGADRENLTGRTLAALLRLQRGDIRADVVLGSASAYSHAVTDLAAGHPQVRLHQNLPSLAPLMAAADLAIGGSGATSWERLCLGLPAIVATLADNQRPVAEALERAGIVRWLGDAHAITDELLTREMANVAGWRQLPFTMQGVPVDGRGVERLCGRMVGAAS